MSRTTNPMPRRARFGLIFGAIGAAGVLAAGLPSLGAAKAATIKIDNFAFGPSDVTITAGTTVIWKNKDGAPHRVADISGAYASAALDTDSSFSHPFATPGVYKYICSLYPYMKGEIVVKPTSPNS